MSSQQSASSSRLGWERAGFLFSAPPYLTQTNWIFPPAIPMYGCMYVWLYVGSRSYSWSFILSMPLPHMLSLLWTCPHLLSLCLLILKRTSVSLCPECYCGLSAQGADEESSSSFHHLHDSRVRPDFCPDFVPLSAFLLLAGANCFSLELL